MSFCMAMECMYCDKDCKQFITGETPFKESECKNNEITARNVKNV